MEPDGSFEFVALGEVAELVMGSSPPGESYNEIGNGVPLINGPAEYGPRNPIPVKWTTAPTRICKAGDALICVRGNTTGRLNLADREYCIGRGLAAIRARPETCAPAFLWWILERLAPRILASATGAGTTFPNINKPQLAALLIPTPPVSDQRAIARILDAADTAIERTRAAIDKARRVRDGLLQTLLTNGIGPDGQVRSREAFPEGYQATKAGWLPRDWQVSTVGVEFEIGTGFTLDESRRPRVNRVRYLRVANVQRGYILLDDIAELEATEEEAAARRLREGDLVVVEGHADPNAIGRCARVPKAAEGLSFQNHLFRLRAKEMASSFASLWLNSQWARRYWRGKCATSSGLNTINQRMLKALLIPKPDPKEQGRIARIVDQAQVQIDMCERSLDRLSRLKRGLMQDLLTGRVRVAPERLTR